MDNSIFCNFDKILPYGALLNFIISERGVGKTYSATKFVTEQFLKKGDEFAYIRRYKNELSSAVPNFFSALQQNNEFPDVSLSAKGKKFFINGKTFGYASTLSTSQDLKSSNFSKVKTIIFDEFIIEERSEKILLKKRGFHFFKLN